MLKLSCKITIGSYVFNYVQQVQISTSWQKFTDTATIILPRHLKLANQPLNELIKVNDEVSIELGYDDELKSIYSGYVTAVKPTTPIEIMCEDAMWLLKKGSITKTWRNATISGILNDVLPDGIKNITNESRTIGTFTAEKQSPAQILEKLKTDYAVVSYFKNGVLMVGAPYSQSIGEDSVAFAFNHSIIDNNLEHKKAEDTKVKVKAISNLADNSKLEETVGDEDGEERTLNFYDVKDKTLLKQSAQNLISTMKYDGMSGSFTTFGEPLVHHWQTVELIDPTDEKKEGRFNIHNINRTFGMDGYRQEIELGPFSKQPSNES